MAASDKIKEREGCRFSWVEENGSGGFIKPRAKKASHTLDLLNRLENRGKKNPRILDVVYIPIITIT